MCARVLVLFVVALIGFNAFAQDKTWLGNQTGQETNFRNANNWSPSGVPGMLDKAIVDGSSSFQPTISAGAAVTVGEIQLTGGATDVELHVSANLTVTTLSITSGASTYAYVTVDSGAALQVATLNISAAAGLYAQLSIDGSVDVTTAMTMVCSDSHQAYVTGTGSFNLNAPAPLNVTGIASNSPAEFDVDATFNGSVTVAANRVLNLANGTYLVHSTCTSSAGNAKINVAGNSMLTCESGGQLAGNFSFADNCVANFDTTQTGMMELSTSASSAMPAMLTGTANPIFGTGADVTFTAGVASARWQAQDGLHNGGIMKLHTSSSSFDFVIPSTGSGDFVNENLIVLTGDTGAQPRLSGAGTLTNSAAANVQVTGDSFLECAINNSGGLLIDTGQLFMTLPYSQSAATAILRVNSTLNASSTIAINGGTLRVNGNATANPSVTLTAGILDGNGTITGNVSNGGSIRPGAHYGIGNLSFNGNFTQTSGGMLEIDIDNTLDQSDQLSVSGTSNLAGTFFVHVINTFPALPKTYADVLTSPGGITGAMTFGGADPIAQTMLRYFAPLKVGTSVNLALKSYAVPQAQAFNVAPSDTFNGTLVSSDEDGDAPTYSIQSFPTKGTVNITNTATGAFTYTANASVSGTDTFTFKVFDGTRASLTAALVTVALAALPVITSIDVGSNPAAIGSLVNFSAVASDPASLPLTYSWNFNDGTPHETTNPVMHAFTAGGTATVTLTVSNGSAFAQMNASLEILGPNSGGETIPNVGDGKPAISNPLNGISLSVASSNGGVVELAVNVDALIRDRFDITTAFDTFVGRRATRSGLRPTEKFMDPGVAVATTIATDGGTMNERGKARRQIAVSSREVGQTAPFTAAPVDRGIAVQAITGKFLFSSAKFDQFTFTGMFELPAGLDVKQMRALEIGIGNIIDAVQIDVKGKAIPSTKKRIIKAQIKYPKVPKTNPLTVAGQKAKLTLTMKGVDFSTQGFDTEGITAVLRSDEAGKKSVPRSIQAAIAFAGSTWEGLIPVDFKLAKNNTSGGFKVRRAN